MSGRVEWQEDVEPVELAVDQPGLVSKREAIGYVGEDDGLTAGRGAGDPAQANLELGQVHEWDERLQRLEPRHRGGPDRKVRLDRLDIPQAQGEGLRESDGPSQRGGCRRREGWPAVLLAIGGLRQGRREGVGLGRLDRAVGRGQVSSAEPSAHDRRQQEGKRGHRDLCLGPPRRPPFRIHHTRSLRRTTVLSSM